jgi:hypothetical protein
MAELGGLRRATRSDVRRSGAMAPSSPLIADALLVRGIRSEEIISPTRTQPIPQLLCQSEWLQDLLSATS